MSHMIASLQGTWNAGVLTVGGVGYKVAVASEPTDGEQVFFLITCSMRENGWTLYGFVDQAEQALFDAICKVQRVGPAAALAILRHLGTAGAAEAIGNKDVARLARTPGVGKKTAESIAAFCSIPDGIEIKEQHPRVAEIAEALDALGLDGESRRAEITETIAAHPEHSDEELLRILLAGGR